MSCPSGPYRLNPKEYGGEIAVKMHRASVMLPTFEPCKTLLQGLVAERRGVFLRFASRSWHLIIIC